MIVRDFSPIPYQGGKLSLSDRTQAIMKFGTNWPADMKSQDTLIRHLTKSLDNSFTILRNVWLPRAEVTVPLILIGPPGITVIYNSPAKGVFRTQGSSWAIMGGRGSFQPSKPNMIMRATLMAGAVQTYLHENSYNDLSVDSVLTFTNPGTHVDAIRPDVRVVLIDALERFAAQLTGDPPILDQQRRFKLVEFLTEKLKSQPEESQPNETPTSDISHSLDAGFDSALKPIRRKANFSKRQWLILGVFVIVEVIVLVLFLFIVLLTA
jgi:hypothetical protein